jgi:L-lactate dehydrogenase complex protein LldG
MKAREEILGRVRSALLTAAEGRSTPANGDHGIRRDYAHTRDLPDRLGLFVERVQDYKATVIRTDQGGIAAAVAKCLTGARSVVVPPGFNTSWVPDGLDIASDEPVLRGDQLDAIDAVVTLAVVGIAVTGTIVLDHCEGQGRRALTLVPDLHVCVVTEDQVVGDVPEAVHRLQSSVDHGRALTWISGGSATSDIELSRVEGVHGPRTLCVVLVESTMPSASAAGLPESAMREGPMSEGITEVSAASPLEPR